jgi:hypothetical protein
MRELLNAAATIGLAAITITVLACLLGWARLHEEGGR